LKPSPLLIIVGETASGKSALGLAAAQQLGGEIICADARTIYKGMDIGTAKSNVDEQKAVPHHLIDAVKPSEHFSAAEFKTRAEASIENIAERGKLPIMVGGTGLYVDAVAYDFSFRPPADPAERARLNELSVEELQAEIIDKGLPMPENKLNKRHLSRVIEANGTLSEHGPLRKNTLLVGLRLPREVLEERVRQRVDMMVAIGFVAEVERLAEQYGWDAPGMQAPGYKAFRSYLEGVCTLDEAKAAFVRNDLQLAKRQRTWFKRNVDIVWFDNQEDAFAYILDHCRRENCRS
jgi:tRNA dimethylallyltransferase